MEVRAAHPAGADLDHELAVAGRRVLALADDELARLLPDRGPHGSTIGLTLSRILAARAQRGLGVVELEVAGDDRLEVDRAGGGQRDRRRVGVGVAERARHPDLAALDQRERQRALLPRPHADEHGGAGGAQRLDARRQRAGMPGALDQRVGLAVELVVAASTVRVGARAPRELQPVRVDVGDRRPRGAERARELHRQLADRPGAGDEHAVARARRPPSGTPTRRPTAAPSARPPRRRARRAARTRSPRGSSRSSANAPSTGGVAKNTTSGQRLYRPGPALAAAPARHARLERHAVADGVLGRRPRRARPRGPPTRGRAPAAPRR